MARTLPTVLLLALALVACDPAPVTPDPDASGGGDPDGGITPGEDAGTTTPPNRLGPTERPATFVVPAAHDGVTPLPLMVLLHGYSASGAVQDAYFRASIVARAMGYYLIVPDGTEDGSGNQFWNATPACCDFGGTGVDDVAYITSLIDEAESVVPVDTTRVYVFGHSNGGFMSYRMACELSDRITAIASLAGADFIGETDCVPDQPVSVLQIHGDMDETIGYGGTAGGYPSARDGVVRWAERAGCDTSMSTMLAPLDLESSLAGAETTVERFEAGCDPGVDAELWTIVGGGHIPTWTTDWMPTLAEWLLSHRRGS